MPIPLQTRIIYGPVRSRRFGRSLGVNLLPSGLKLCNFDCLYCQYGSSGHTKGALFPTLDEIRTEWKSFLEGQGKAVPPADWIILAGNGEPTLHPQFSEAIDLLVSLRDQTLPEVPIGVLSNSSTCRRPEIAQALSKLDGRFMKLDAGMPWIFRLINEPKVPWEEVLQGLRGLKNIVLQSLFFTGYLAENAGEEKVAEWIRVVRSIAPLSVQIYTLDRPARDLRLLPVSSFDLRKISQRLLDETGIPSTVFV